MATPQEKIEALKRAVVLMDAETDTEKRIAHRTALAEMIHELTVAADPDAASGTGGIYCEACGYFMPLGPPPLPASGCQCGAAKVKDSTHADWCPAKSAEPAESHDAFRRLFGRP